MTGLVNSFYPFLNTVDRWLELLLPPLGRICLWALISSTIAMGIYWVLSSQEKIRDKKRESRSLRNALRSFDGDFDEVVRLSLKNLKTSLKLLSIIGVPAIVSACPIVLTIFWLTFHFSYHTPQPGDLISISVVPENVDIEIGPLANRIEPEGNKHVV